MLSDVKTFEVKESRQASLGAQRGSSKEVFAI
jgi:hypothetical protein